MLTPIYYDSPTGLPVDREKLATHFAPAPADPARRHPGGRRERRPPPRLGRIILTGQTLVVDGDLDTRFFSDTSYADFMGGLMPPMTGE